ncbi:MAG: GGDEF domain-containing protein [Polyangiales bacterium]
MLPSRKTRVTQAMPAAGSGDDLRQALVHCLELLTQLASGTNIPVEDRVRLRRLKMSVSSARGAVELEAVGLDICGLALPPPRPVRGGPSVDSIVAGAAHVAEEVADAAAVPGLSKELRRLAAMPAPSPLPPALAEFGSEMNKLRDVVRFLRERGDLLSSTATGMAEHLGGLSPSGSEALARLNTNKTSIADADNLEDLQSLRTSLLSSVEGLIRETEARIREGQSAMELVQMHETHRTLLEAALVNSREMAHGDALTGFGNERALDSMVRSDAVDGGVVGVIALTLDGLAQKRERDGRDTVGAVIQQFAHALKGELSSSARAFRLDGDVFVLMLPNHDLSAATGLATKLHQRFAAAPLRALGRDVDIRLSVGVSAWTAGKGFRDVFAKADKLRAIVAKKGGNAVRSMAC